MSNLESQTTDNLTNQDHDDIDEDDDPSNSSHKIIANISKPTTSGENPIDQFHYDLRSLIKNDIKKYLYTTMPKDSSDFVQCHIKREKEGLTKGFSRIFTLYLDGQNENDLTFLLMARKHITIGGHSEYFIGAHQENPTKNLNEDNSIAKLRAISLTSTEYVLYDLQNASNPQKQLAAICYDDHVFASKQPRKLIILLPDNENDAQPLKDNETIIDQWKSGRVNHLTELRNQAPAYNEETKAFIINLRENRVKQPSHKNFQLTTSTEGENNIAMQFGRIDENNFALDYRYPLTTLQAFAIALSSFHNRLLT